MQTQPKPYRRGVGAVLFNRENLVFVAERIDSPGAWQFPQGGLDDGEEPRTGVMRELHEEIGTNKATIIDEIPEWLSYDFPPELAHHPVYQTHCGQTQKWFALRFLGTDADINLNAHDEIEFSRYQWVPLADTPHLIVPFKQALYHQLVAAFAPLVAMRP